MDIKNHNLNANKKLIGDSEKEILTDILDFQDRNIEFWRDRYNLPLILFILFIILVFLFMAALIIQSITLVYVDCLGAIVVILMYLIYLFLRYSNSLREKPLKEKISKFRNLICNTCYLFGASLPTDKILEDKLAICKDYAKFTASLLYIIYPDSELRFIAIYSHVAAGIEINNKIYVLDQHLPIKLLDNWQRINKTAAGIYKLKIDKGSKEKLIDVVFDRIEPNPVKSNYSTPKINTEKLTKLTEETAQILGIRQSSDIDIPDLEIPLRNYARYYEDDEIITYSLIRKIRNQLETEFYGKIDKISKVNINQSPNRRDLIVTVWL